MFARWWLRVRCAFTIVLVALVSLGATAAVAQARVSSSRAKPVVYAHIAKKKRRHHKRRHKAIRCVAAKKSHHTRKHQKSKRKRKHARRLPTCSTKHRGKKHPPSTPKAPAPPAAQPAPPPIAVVPVVEVPCTTTLSPGADVGAAIASAPAGGGVCLNSGSYPTINVNGANPPGYVTLEPAPGAHPTIDGAQISNSSFLRFQQLQMTGGFNMIKSGQDFQFLDNNVGPAQYGFVMDGSPNPITNVVIQGNAIHDLDFSGSSAGYAGGQGVTLYNGDDVVVSENTFWANSWHYIQCGGCDGLAVDHNLFTCPCNEHSGAHLNILQIWQGGSDDSFTNNIVNGTGGPTEICGGCILLENGAGGQTCSDRFVNPNVSNNLFVDPGGSLPIQVNLNDGGVFENNTIVGGQYGSAFGNATSTCSSSTDTNMTVARNIQVGDTSSGSNLWMGNCSGTCTFDYNVTSDGSARADGSQHYVIDWRASWAGNYVAVGLPFTAGYQGSIGP